MRTRAWAMFFLLELIGTIAFAISGAATGIRRHMDVFGVSMLAMTCAVGGGIIRDIILNVTPPAAFRDPLFAGCAIACGIGVFLVAKLNAEPRDKAPYNVVLRTMDAIGLGIFTVIGVRTAIEAGSASNTYLTVFVGVLTGVGGGIMRDVFAQRIPYVFSKHFYACASLIGAVACTLAWPILGEMPSMIAGALLVVVLRNWASHYRWGLPRIP